MKRGPGRPKVSSVETLSEAAIELFLEVGFERVSIDDIAGRAGVSRGTFFTYFPGGKSDALWCRVRPTLDAVQPSQDGPPVRACADALVSAVAPWEDRVPQVLRDAETMGATEVLLASAGVHAAELSAVLAHRIAIGEDILPESNRASGVAGALIGAAFGAIGAWARTPEGTAEEAVRAAVEPLVEALER